MATRTACSWSPASADPEAARARGPELAAALSARIARYIEERWRVPSQLELKFEKLYREAVSAAGASQHARREQALRGSASRRGSDSVEFVGMEVVRRDWTALAKQVQRELYQRLFTDQAVDAYLADIVRQRARRRRSMMRSSIARICARMRRSTRRRRRRTSWRRASRRSRRALISYVDDDCGSGAARQRAASARSRALRRQAGAASRGARAGNARPGFRAGDRRHAAAFLVLARDRSFLARDRTLMHMDVRMAWSAGMRANGLSRPSRGEAKSVVFARRSPPSAAGHIPVPGWRVESRLIFRVVRAHGSRRSDSCRGAGDRQRGPKRRRARSCAFAISNSR